MGCQRLSRMWVRGTTIRHLLWKSVANYFIYVDVRNIDDVEGLRRLPRALMLNCPQTMRWSCK